MVFKVSVVLYSEPDGFGRSSVFCLDDRSCFTEAAGNVDVCTGFPFY